MPTSSQTPRRRPQIDHFSVAAACRTHAGEWQTVGEYNSSQSAQGMVGTIRKAYTRKGKQSSAYVPAGAFEARYELTEFGARVEARFIGSSDDAAWAEALTSLTGGAR
ncbi:hypothetical protein ACF1AL_14600 [Streptomyces sp. NPDC014801]|uniref:hypothetical protein n=1 Tax=Streptomyces sp. NPDC014801 TaxID=3364916 RepID=UPI0036FB6A93